jgi:hypothetical protein
MRAFLDPEVFTGADADARLTDHADQVIDEFCG